MEQKDKKPFGLLMKRLRVTFPSNLSEEDEALRGQVYWEEFKGIPVDLFEIGVRGCIGDSSFFPKPTELWEIIRVEQRRRYDTTKQKEAPMVTWREPNEAGREMAKSFLNQIYEQVDKVNIQKKKERGDRFEERRRELKKQAKLLVK